ncbi:MAG: pentapeptide repeat-containing protein, partial [Clostridia bacterium]|nr:pentapeptide repeat-containing protein [Clostridia bacterium]
LLNVQRQHHARTAHELHPRCHLGLHAGQGSKGGCAARCRTALGCGALSRTVLSRAVLRCVVLSHAVLSRAVLRCVVLSHAPLCHVALGRAVRLLACVIHTFHSPERI